MGKEKLKIGWIVMFNVEREDSLHKLDFQVERIQAIRQERSKTGIKSGQSEDE